MDSAFTADQEAEVEVQGHRRRRKRRQIDWDKPRQIRHAHDLSHEEKVCSCCGRTMDRIGEDVTRELELEPAKLEAHIHVRPKYACRHCKDGVSAAPLPPRPIPGGIAGPGLITEVIVGKLGDHLPLYRLEDILTRYGVYIPRSTLCDWVKSAAELFRPLHDLQRERVLESSVMWTDDTPITVLGGAKRHRIEPWGYVREILLRLHADDPLLEEMLPDRWAAAHPEAILTHRLENPEPKPPGPVSVGPIAAPAPNSGSLPSPTIPSVLAMEPWTDRTLTNTVDFRHISRTHELLIGVARRAAYRRHAVERRFISRSCRASRASACRTPRRFRR